MENDILTKMIEERFALMKDYSAYHRTEDLDADDIQEAITRLTELRMMIKERFKLEDYGNQD